MRWSCATPIPRLMVLVPTLLALAACRGDGDGEIERRVPRTQRNAELQPVPQAVALAYWPGSGADQLSLYPAPTAVSTVERAREIPRVAFDALPADAAESVDNAAVRIELLGTSAQPTIFSHAAPAGTEFLVVDTRWRNIHPRQRIEKSQLEGKADRSMGLGNFASGGSGGSSSEMVDADVAYLVPSLLDHLYLVADGIAYPLHSASAELPDGTNPLGPVTLAKLGDERIVRGAFLVPADARDVALHFFDYEYGHVSLPVRGNAKRAGGGGDPPRGALARGSSEQLELAALSLDLHPTYDGVPAPASQQFAVVRLGGKSISTSGNLMNIVQVDPLKFTWLEGDGGYIYPASSGSINQDGLLRFTPEIYQQQEIAFLVPAAADRLQLGMRVQDAVVRLQLTKRAPEGPPRAKKSYRDGSTMEVQLLGTRRTESHLVLDLAIRPLIDDQGIEITADQQFLLVTAGDEVAPDMPASWALPHPPMQPLVVPPGTPMRFELAFPLRGEPTGLRVRGFESDGQLEF